MTLLTTLSINVNQRPNWSITEDSVQKVAAMRPVLDCIAILGKARVKSTTMVVSDRFLSKTPGDRLMWAPATWITQRWTMEEKRFWVEEVMLAMQDSQFFSELHR